MSIVFIFSLIIANEDSTIHGRMILSCQSKSHSNLVTGTEIDIYKWIYQRIAASSPINSIVQRYIE